jgi:hypothetical protein
VNGQGQLKRKRRLWAWFAAGFLLVFIGMSLTVTMYSMHSSGQYVVGYKLWQYYLVEIQRALQPTQALGPTTGSTAAAVTTLVQHLLCSAVGGAVMLGIGWVVHKVKGRRA